MTDAARDEEQEDIGQEDVRSTHELTNVRDLLNADDDDKIKREARRDRYLE